MSHEWSAVGVLARYLCASETLREVPADAVERLVLAVVDAATSAPSVSRVLAATACAGHLEHVARNAVERLLERGAVAFNRRLELVTPQGEITRLEGAVAAARAACDVARLEGDAEGLVAETDLYDEAVRALRSAKEKR
jgi:hypothetical protein